MMEEVLDKERYRELFGLTPEQKRAMRSLERALEKCSDAGVFISNQYGELFFYNGEFVRTVDDVEDEFEIPFDYGETISSRYKSGLVSWSDDQTWIHLHDYKKHLWKGDEQ